MGFMTYNLFLDDMRLPQDAFYYTNYMPYITENWVIVRNVSDFTSHIVENGMPKRISFDHDLSEHHYGILCDLKGNDMMSLHDTGYSAAKWLIYQHSLHPELDWPEFMVHSMNPVGKENIESLLRSYEKNKKG
jgi:hypothetical protein